MLKRVKGMSERMACKTVGLSRSTYRTPKITDTPQDPDAELRGWLRDYSTKHPCHGFRRAWAALRHDEGRQINRKKVHRLWTDEGLQRKIRSARKRAGESSAPPFIEADAPKVVWAIDFQFDSTIDGKAIKIASAVDEHTKQSVLNIVERSIDAPRLVQELEKAFTAAGGPPQVLRLDNGPEFISQVLRGFCDGRVGLDYIPPGTPWNNGTAESFNSRMRRELLNRNHWTCLLEARVRSLTTRRTTTPDIGIHRWATSRPTSTLPSAGTPTPRWPARSTERRKSPPGLQDGVDRISGTCHSTNSNARSPAKYSNS